MSRLAAVEPERRLLNKKLAAAYLSVSVRAIETLAARGEFTKIPINGRVLFDKADLDAFVDRAKASA